MQTEQIDMLFLELSQFVTAKTNRELKLEAQNKKLIDAVRRYFKVSDYDEEFNMMFDQQPEKHAQELKEKVLLIISEIERSSYGKTN